MENDELSHIAPNLSKIDKSPPYDVPKDYFEEFPLRMQEKTKENTPIPFHNRIFNLLRPQLKLAGAFIILAIVAFSLFQLISGSYDHTVTDNNDLAIVSDNENSIFEDMFDEDEIIAVLNENSNDTAYSDDDIINYLVDNNVDYLAYLEEN